MDNKTHYRKVYKSDHLGVVDLEEYQEQGRKLVFTISHVRQEYNTKVAGKSIDCNIAYFKERIKPLVLNATNSKVIRGFCKSPFVEDWNNIPVELYIDSSVKMKGMVVGGVRIRGTQPRIEKEVMNNKHAQWDMAVGKAKGGMSFEEMNKYYYVTKEVWEELCK